MNLKQTAAWAACLATMVCAQNGPPTLALYEHTEPILDAHNCYPYEGQYADRIDRALATGRPVGIEQDMAWYVDPATNQGRAVVSHSAQARPTDPTLEQHFFTRVRPLLEKAMAEKNTRAWPLIILHFDFKDNRPELLHAVWDILGKYEPFLSTATKTNDLSSIQPLHLGPLLVLTEDPDAQQAVFYDQVPVGGTLRLFGSAHTVLPAETDKQQLAHLVATLSPQELLPKPADNYRRWWNNGWAEVEEGGQQHAGSWTQTDESRLHDLVTHAHRLGYWIRFYTIDGFDASTNRGWFQSYNFGSLAAAQERWAACRREHVDMIASDQYEDLRAALNK